MKRDYMIQFRTQTGLSVREMARYLKISPRLLEMLEEDDQAVTHPKIARRVAKTYHLTEAQYLRLIPKNYRPGPEYDPGKYVQKALEFEDFAPLSQKGAALNDEHRRIEHEKVYAGRV